MDAQCTLTIENFSHHECSRRKLKGQIEWCSWCSSFNTKGLECKVKSLLAQPQKGEK